MHSCVKPWLFILLAGIHVYSWTAEHQKTTHTKSVHLSQRTRSSGDGKEDEEDAHFKKIAIPVGITVAALIAAGLYANSHGYFDRAKKADQDSLKDPDELTRKQPLFNVQPSGVRIDSSPEAASSGTGSTSSTFSTGDKPLEENKNDADSNDVSKDFVESEDEEDTQKSLSELNVPEYYAGQYCSYNEFWRHVLSSIIWDEKTKTLSGTHETTSRLTQEGFVLLGYSSIHAEEYAFFRLCYQKKIEPEEVVDTPDRNTQVSTCKPSCFVMFATEYRKLSLHTPKTIALWDATTLASSPQKISDELKVHNLTTLRDFVQTHSPTSTALINDLEAPYGSLALPVFKLVNKDGYGDEKLIAQYLTEKKYTSSPHYKVVSAYIKEMLDYSKFLKNHGYQTSRDLQTEDISLSFLNVLFAPDLVITPAITAS